MLLMLFVAVVGKVVGCGLAALGSGMDWVRSLRVGCGMMSRGEVGLIVTAMGAATGIFGRTEVAVMVAVVLLTTLLTPIALRGAFDLKSRQDIEEGIEDPMPKIPAISGQASASLGASRPEAVSPPGQSSFSVMTPSGTSLLAFEANDAALTSSRNVKTRQPRE